MFSTLRPWTSPPWKLHLQWRRNVGRNQSKKWINRKKKQNNVTISMKALTNALHYLLLFWSHNFFLIMYIWQILWVINTTLIDSIWIILNCKLLIFMNKFSYNTIFVLWTKQWSILQQKKHWYKWKIFLFFS